MTQPWASQHTSKAHISLLLEYTTLHQVTRMLRRVGTPTSFLKGLVLIWNDTIWTLCCIINMFSIFFITKNHSQWKASNICFFGKGSCLPLGLCFWENIFAYREKQMNQMPGSSLFPASPFLLPCTLLWSWDLWTKEEKICRAFLLKNWQHVTAYSRNRKIQTWVKGLSVAKKDFFVRTA